MKVLRRIPLAAAAFAVSLAFAGSALADANEDAASQVASAWLQLIDSGQYAETWKQAAQPFHYHVSQARWADLMQQSREPLGAVESRQISSASYTEQLPGAPDGKYVVVKFNTSFEHKQNAEETVTPVLENGVWKVTGYFVK